MTKDEKAVVQAAKEYAEWAMTLAPPFDGRRPWTVELDRRRKVLCDTALKLVKLG